MLSLRCLLRPSAAVWLLCSMGFLPADDGVARVSDLRSTTGVASTTALRAARQAEAAPTPAPAAAAVKSVEEACGEDGCGEHCGKCPCVGEGCGECGCTGKGCGECGCKGHGVSGASAGKGGGPAGLLGRLFGGKGGAGSRRSGAGGNVGHGGSAAHGAGGAVHGGAAGGKSGVGGDGHGAPGVAQTGQGGNGSANGSANGGSGLSGGNGAGVQGGHGGQAADGRGNGHGGGDGLSGDGRGQHGSIYRPATPGQWFGGHGQGVCPNCRCNPCRCGNGHCPNGQVDYGDKVFNCLFGWACPSGACGQGLPLVGKYHMVYADQPGYVNPADTQLYSAPGYGMPMTVPLAPTVNYQYNYSAGLPASRVTTIGTWNPVTSPQALPYQSW